MALMRPLLVLALAVSALGTSTAGTTPAGNTTAAGSTTAVPEVTCPDAATYFSATPNIVIDNCNATVGTTCHPACASGFKLILNDVESSATPGTTPDPDTAAPSNETEIDPMAIHCHDDGAWNVAANHFTCRPLAKCTVPADDATLKISPDCVGVEDLACTFQCADDHETTVEADIVSSLCTDEGEWSPSPPRCIPTVKLPSMRTVLEEGLIVALDSRHDMIVAVDGEERSVGVVDMDKRLRAVADAGGTIDTLETTLLAAINDQANTQTAALEQQNTKQDAALNSAQESTENALAAHSLELSTEVAALSDSADQADASLSTEAADISEAVTNVEDRLQLAEESAASVSTATKATIIALQQTDTDHSTALSTEQSSTSAARKSLGDSIGHLRDVVDVLAMDHGDLSDAHSKLSDTVFKTIEDEITAEETRAKAAEATLSNNIAATSTAVVNEKNRAVAAENGLGTRLTNAENAISAERTRATDAENSINARVTGVSNKLNTVSSKVNSVSTYAYYTSRTAYYVSRSLYATSVKVNTVSSGVNSGLKAVCEGLGGSWTGSKCLPLQCTSYSTIDDWTRWHGYGSSSRCDNSLAKRWYRFKVWGRDAMVPTSAVWYYRCYTYYPGWYSGSMPSKVGQTTVGRMCYRYPTSSSSYYYTCYWKQENVQVTHCGTFYVYNYGPTNFCYARACLHYDNV